MNLSTKKCVPCEGGVPRVTGDALTPYLAQVPEWKLVDGKSIEKVFKFKDFAEAMAFVNKVAALAEEEGHHPDINVHWDTVTLSLWTHEIGGLSENDFIVAAKIRSIAHGT